MLDIDTFEDEFPGLTAEQKFTLAKQVISHLAGSPTGGIEVVGALLVETLDETDQDELIEILSAEGGL